MAHIVSIDPAGPTRRARRICFQDGSARTTSARVVKALGLEPDSDVGDVEPLLEPFESEIARERAQWLVGYRERSVRELTAKLLEDGYPEGLVAEIVEAYQRVGLLDDARFAEMYIRTRLASGYGTSRIKRELAEKGVAADLAEQLLSEHAADDERERARAVLRGRRPADRKERERMLRKLVSKGFTMGVALDVTALGDDDDAHEAFSD